MSNSQTRREEIATPPSMMVQHPPCWEERIEIRERQRHRELEQALTRNQTLARKYVGWARGHMQGLGGQAGSLIFMLWPEG